MSGWTGKQPSAWSGGTKAGLTALLRNSVQELANEAGRTIPNGGRVPVKTGNLARSVVVSNTRPNVLVYGPPNPNALSGVATIQPGEDIWLGWTAIYSRRMNSGYVGTDSLGRTYNFSGFGFAESTAAKWGAIVAKQAAKMGSR